MLIIVRVFVHALSLSLSHSCFVEGWLNERSINIHIISTLIKQVKRFKTTYKTLMFATIWVQMLRMRVSCTDDFFVYVAMKNSW